MSTETKPYASLTNKEVQEIVTELDASRTDTSNNERKTIRMHRLILNVNDPNVFIDHINHNTLDNRKCNLRISNRSENMKNRNSAKNSSSKYLGVTLRVESGNWRALISDGIKSINIGHFKNEIDAAKAYDKKAKEIHGEFANLNFK